MFSGKKIGLIGNMNNNFFALTRYLRDAGYQAELIIVGEENAHFPPQSDSYEQGFTDYVFNESWYLKGCFTENRFFQQQVADRLSQYDFLIGCGYAPFFCQRYGFKLDVFVPYGDDFYRLPFPAASPGLLTKILHHLDLGWRKLAGQDLIMRVLRYLKMNHYYAQYRQFKLAWHQSKGIRDTNKIVMLAGIQNFNPVLESLGVTDKLNQIPVPMVYHTQYTPETLELHRQHLPFLNAVMVHRQNHDLLIMHHPRHIWQTHVDEFSVKGNDVLFHGIAQYLQQGGTRKVGVITLEYGPDVDASKALIDSLGFTEHVLWLPLSPRKDIMSIMPLADLGANCFSHNWLTGGVLYECIVSGLPVLQKRESFIPNVFPVLESNSASDVAAWLFRWDTDRDEIKRRAEAAKLWYINDVAGKAVQFYSRAIDDALQLADSDGA